MTTISRNLHLAKLLLSELVQKFSGYPFFIFTLFVILLWKGYSLVSPLSSPAQEHAFSGVNTLLGQKANHPNNHNFVSVLPSEVVAANDVVSFTLINADTDVDIATLTNGAVINVSTIGTRNLAIRANVDAQPIGSVYLVLSGPVSNQRTENVAPYSLFGDVSGNYEGASFANGSYTISGTSYTQINRQGTPGTTLQVSFSITDQTGGNGDSFSLINATNDTEIVTLNNGTVVNLAAIGNPGVNIRFNPGNGQTQSMQFILTGPTSVTRTENIAPYAIFGDNNGDFIPGTLSAGSYTLVGKSYSASNLGGTLLATTQVMFTIQNQVSQGNLSASPSELIFDIVRFNTSPSQTLTLTNTTGNTVQLTEISTSTAIFTRTSAHTFPISLANGQSLNVNVAFAPGSAVGALSGTLNFKNGSTTLLSVGLYGLSVNGLEGVNEPTLHNVVNTLGYNINVGWTTLGSNTNPALMGEEVNVQLFERAGGGNVGILPVARYSPKETLPFGYYTKSGNTPIKTQVGVLTDAGNEHQALFPVLSSGNTSFNPGSASFGIYVHSNSFGRSNYTEDEFNTGGVAHRVRTYPMKNRQGQLIANSYLVCFEDASNGDYQDYMYVLSNVKPAGSGGVANQSLLKINAGGTQYTDSNSQIWLSDNYFTGGSSGSKSFNVAGTTDDEIYLKYRFGTNFSYNVPLSVSSPVTVVLHFVEPYFGVSGPGGTGIRVFNVNIESGQGVLTNFDINALTSPGTALTRTFNNISVTGGVLNINFTAVKDNAIISGIEIFGQDTDPNAQNPYIVAIHDGELNIITEGETSVPTDVNLSSTQLFLPNGSVDNTTVNNNTIKLTKVSTGQVVSATVNSTGGGDALTLVPAAHLEPFTQYRFEVTGGVKDLNGVSFLPYTLNFTTGQEVVVDPGDLSGVSFSKVDQPGTLGRQYTSLVIGPDNRMYASTVDGYIERFDIDANGNLVSRFTISTIRNHTRSGVNAGSKIVIGMAFDPSSTATNLKLWITYMNTYVFEGAPDWDGNVAYLSGSNLQNMQDVVINLPRSVRDHLTNSVAFGPDGALYISQAGSSAMGKADLSWGNREERILSAAILRLNVSNLPGSLPINAKSEDGGSYNPYATGAPLTIYATGLRNAYDLVWHSNGELYVPTNGSAAGGNSPTSNAADPNFISKHPNAPNYTGGFVPMVTNITPTQRDWLFRVRPGKYYGHPNPRRGEYTVGRGDIEIDNAAYNGVQPDPDYDAQGLAYDFALNKSANGVIEYKSNAFSGKLQGKLLVVRYSEKDDIIVLQPGGTNKNIINATEGVALGLSGFNNPLDLTEDTRNGYLYVSEYGGFKITMLKPQTVSPASSSITRLVLVNAATNQDITQINNGATINISGIGTTQLSIRAETNPSVVSSVHMSLSGAKTSTRTESSAPYSLYGDVDATGDYFGQSFGNGNYTISATPYTQGSIKGQDLSVSFTITGSTYRATSQVKPTTESFENTTPQVTKAYPIPLNQNKLNIDLSTALEGNIDYAVYNSKGQKVIDGTLQLEQPETNLELDLKGVLKENEIYYLKLSGIDEVFKIINK